VHRSVVENPVCPLPQQKRLRFHAVAGHLFAFIPMLFHLLAKPFGQLLTCDTLSKVLTFLTT